MDEFVNSVNRHWDRNDALVLAAFVLWKMNYIHPFVNGNGRTARALSYYVLCVKVGGLINTTPLLPEIIRQNRSELVGILKRIDASLLTGQLDIEPMRSFIERLLVESVPEVAEALKGDAP